MMPKQGLHFDYDLRGGEAVADAQDCLICGNSLKHNSVWTDYSGQVECRTCGAAYNLTEEGEPKINLKPEWIERARLYWTEHKRHMSMGDRFLRQTLEQGDNVQAFNRWAKEHYPEVAPAEKDTQ